jgi:hypothetical protein
MRRIAALGSLVAGIIVSTPPAVVRADTVTLVRTLTAPDAFTGDEFGSSVVVTPDSRIFVGAPMATLKNTGAVYLFDQNGTALHEFTKSDAAMDDRFGAAIAVVGSTLAVGVPFDGKDESGAVVLYDLGGTYLQKKVLKNNVGGSLFGFAVAPGPTPNTIVIGAPREKVAGQNAGAVYICDLTTYALVKIGSAEKPGDDFAWSVGTVGANVVVGAPQANAATGKAYVISPAGTVLRTFVGEATADQFGYSVAGVGTRAVVGAPLAGVPSNAGSVYVFDADPASSTFGQQVQKLAEPTPAASDRFGYVVAARDLDILVAAPLSSVGSVDNAGQVYVMSGATGGLLGTLAASDPGKEDQFGGGDEKSTSKPLGRSPIGAAGTVIAIGAAQHDGSATSPDSGAVYVYDVQVPPPPPPAGGCHADSECANGNACDGDEHCVASQCVAGTPLDCNRGDICFVDSCSAAGGCAHRALAGMGALDCRLAKLDSYLASQMGAFRGALAAHLEATLNVAHRQLTVAETSHGKKAKRAIKKVRARLQTFVAMVKHGKRRQRVDGGVADALNGMAQDAIARVPGALSAIR